MAAQDTYLRWAKHFPGTLTNKYGRGLGITIDSTGNVYTVGIFTGTMDLDPGPGVVNVTAASTDVYVSKLDMFGNFVWGKTIAGSFGTLSRSVSLDKDFNVYVTGTFQATVDFDLGPGTYNMTANGSTDLFVLKLTTDGDFVWAKQIGGPAGTAESYATVTDSNGNVWFAGNYRGSIDFDPGPGNFVLTSNGTTFTDVYIAKLDTDGNFVWAGSVGASQGDTPLAISADKHDNIYITGYFGATVDFDPGPGTYTLSSAGNEDIFILKLGAAGNFVWARSIGGTGEERGYKAVADDAGNVYATGYFRGTVDFDPGPGVFNMTTPGGDAIYILKLDNAGNFVWAKSIGGPSFNNWGYSLCVDKVGNLYSTGFFIGPADFDPGPGTFMLNSAGVDMFLLKLDNNGNFIWAKSAGAAGQDQGLGIAVDRFLNIYTTGQFGGTVDFDLETPVYNLTAIPISDPFVLKVSQCAAPSYDTLRESVCLSYTLNGQTYTTSGTYQQLLYNSIGCDSLLTLELTVITEVFSTVNASICPGQSYYAGGANQTTAGIYKDTLITSGGCDSIITTHLAVYPAPQPNLGADRNLCANETASITPGIFSSYLWQDNSTQPAFTISSSRNKYWVRVTDANNCSASDTLNILSIDTIPKNFLPADQELCQGNVLKITVPDYTSYLWNTGSTADAINISSAGLYFLTVKDLHNCSGTDSITIQRKNCIIMGIPNAFTPNGNSLNDVFRPTIFQAVKSFYFVVFNRYGQKIFETREYGQGWDGSFKGKAQPAGAYVYRVQFINAAGLETVENGSVLLIR